jgi:2-oxo-4-hydroxy-4-carboxy-5-ureidoimidazoline decarboxylase
MGYAIGQLNQMSQVEFTATLGEIFEQTPAIASSAWHDRPFANVTDLHEKMLTIVANLSIEAKIALICAHPDLGSRAKMADASVQEQAGVGLDQLTPEEFDRFQELNQAYRNQFGFPFIIAVKQHTKASILAAFEQRLQHSAVAERETAISEIGKIAGFRLNDLVEG